MLPTGLPARTALAAALLLTAGCSTSSGEGTPGGTDAPSGEDPATWSTSTDPVEVGGLVWASGSVVHLADGTTIDVGGPATTYVPAGDGVYFTPAESDEDVTEHSNMTTAPLHFADRDGSVSATGLTIYVESLASSPDGRYLGLIDATSGPEDRFSDYPQATAVIVDLTTGERVVDTTDGMGDPQEDDLAHDYPEVYLRVRFPDNDSAFVEGLGDDTLYALPSGDGEAADHNDVGLLDPADPTSPDGAWAIEDHDFHDRVVSASGDVVRLSTGVPRWDLRWWLDDSTVVGVAISGPGKGLEILPTDRRELMTCQVPDGACTLVEGTSGALVIFPWGSGEEVLNLPDGEGGGAS
ncbi:hypothetical protein [Nocardioides astragali]|uniref:Uncharacterized protein n=1 Tax=Nocardioides astragali TaxID=1776736 RepID=A0ABW2N489_9ACTN|nr:hypothetical protein [Nocardioides astragali]